MTFNQNLKLKNYQEIWQKYCGFLDFTMPEYMDIQKRLMMEQIEMYASCELGKHIMKNYKPRSIEEYRKVIPLTTYDDYCDMLLSKSESFLPSKPIIWIETTWEGGKHPVKVAPYTDSMVRAHRDIFLTCLVLATSDKKGSFSIRKGDKFLYGMAPLPYLTGLAPYSLQGELDVRFLPPTKEAEKMSFSQRNKIGFKLGMKKGIDILFGMSSVLLRMSETFSDSNNSSSEYNPFKTSFKMNVRLIRAWLRKKIYHIPILPKDIWGLKTLICAGTDTYHLKEKIEEYWGIKPFEIFGGTEGTCFASETWTKNGMVLFPDVNFYEFIPYEEMEKNLNDPLYTPRTYLMDELVPGNTYELVISSLKGGAFARYRLGDLFLCVSDGKDDPDVKLPRFQYVDRVPSVIDISGFTRLTETTIRDVIDVSKLDIGDWFAVKEYNQNKRSFLHLYVEMNAEGIKGALVKEIIKDHLSIYFKYIDNDYKDLKKLLGIDPLEVTILTPGTMVEYVSKFGKSIRKINPSPFDVIEITKISEQR